jgi:membrane fusion protein, multidrug efflux system
MRLILLAFCAMAAVLLAGCGQTKSTSLAASAPPAVPVTVAKVTSEAVPTEVRVVGTVEASSIVQVKSQVAGELLDVGFAEGQNVRKGDLLFRIDPRPYQDALRQAEAAVERDKAQINQGEAAVARDAAQAKFAQTDAERYAELQKAGVVSKSQYDQSRTTADVSRESARATQAALESARAALAADTAAVSAARLNLSYCEIQAPISGRTGNLLVHAGNLVKPNDVPLVVIHQVEPTFVYFSVPEQHLAAIRRLNAARPLEVRVYTKDNPDRANSGRVAVIDNTVDPATGTIRLKAVFDNRGGALWPGQFVTSVLTLDTVRNATVVPAEAVQNGQQGQFVYVVKADNRVEPRVVKVGRAFGKKMMIDSGVAPGDTVVTDGHLRLFPGAQVQAVDGAAMKAGQS